MLQGFGRIPTGVVSPTNNDIIVRQSYQGQMELCPARLGYAMSYDLPFKFAEGRFFGVGLHACADYMLTHDPMSAVYKTEDILLEAYINEYGEGAVPFDRAFVDEVRSAIRSLAEFFMPHQEDILFLEDKMYYPLGEYEDGRFIWLQGTPDVVMTHEILDWKTGKRAWTKFQSAASPQPSLYRRMVQWNHDIDPPKFRFVAYNRGNGQWLTDVTDRTDAEIEAALKNIFQYGIQIAAQAFPAKPFKDTFGKKTRAWYCSTTWCDAWDVCEFKEVREVKED